MKLLKYVLLVLFFVSTADATESRATVTKIAEYSDVTVYYWTASVTNAVADTVEIGDENGKPFWLAGVGTEGITLTTHSSEATADSIRHAYIWQISGVRSPGNDLYADVDWAIAEVDSAGNGTTFSNTHTMAQLTVAPGASRLRIFVAEIFGPTLKDANQTLYGYVFIPKPLTAK